MLTLCLDFTRFFIEKPMLPKKTTSDCMPIAVECLYLYIGGLALSHIRLFLFCLILFFAYLKYCRKRKKKKRNNVTM